MRYDHFTMLPENAFSPRGGRSPFGGGMTLEGGGKGGGGSAPAPDPNIGIAARQNADLAAAQYRDFQNNVWPELQRQSRIQLDMSTKLGEQQYNLNLKNADLADKYQARMETQFYPLQDKLIADAKAYNTEGNFERQAALAIGDVNTASDVNNKNTAMQMRSFGINPNSGAYQGQMGANSVMQSATAAAAATKARTAAEQLGWAKSMDAIGLGQGLPGNQATSTGIALTAGNSALQAGQTNIANTQALGNSYAQGYGGAMQGWNSVGQLGVQSYNGQLSAFNAQQQANAQSSAGWGSLAGSMVGAVGNYYSMGALGAAKAASDIRTKENIELITKFPNGLNLYEFEYKPEFKDKQYFGHGRFIGYMAHEVEKVQPEAVFVNEDGYKVVDYSKVN